MEIRIATSADAKDLYKLNALFGNEASLKHITKSLAENNREIVCLAYANGVLAGYCAGLIVESACYDENRADIEALYVREEYRGRGIGRALIRHIENILASRGIRHFHITTYTDGKTAARRLYKSLGYGKTGEILLDKSI